MKKQIAIFTILALLTGCASSTHQSTNTSSQDSSLEMESITVTNDVQLETKELDMSGYKYLKDTAPAFEQISMAESIRLMDEGGTGIVIYSYPDCPWCNRAIPVLNSAAKKVGVKAYYVDVYEPEVADSENFLENETVKSLLSHLDSILVHEKNEETGVEEPTLYTPEVVAIKDGQIVDHHTALVDDFEMKNSESQLTSEQTRELIGIYLKMYQEIAD